MLFEGTEITLIQNWFGRYFVGLVFIVSSDCHLLPVKSGLFFLYTGIVGHSGDTKQHWTVATRAQSRGHWEAIDHLFMHFSFVANYNSKLGVHFITTLTIVILGGGLSSLQTVEFIPFIFYFEDKSLPRCH
jgi:hypothetical protein